MPYKNAYTAGIWPVGAFVDRNLEGSDEGSEVGGEEAYEASSLSWGPRITYSCRHQRLDCSLVCLR